MPYTLPPGEDHLSGACAFEDGFCTWTGRSTHLWRPDVGWTPLSSAPARIDSGFELKSGILVGANTHIGFLPSGSTDWAGWTDLATFSDAHPLYGDLLLCIDAHKETYNLFSISSSGLDHRSSFGAAELGEPVAGWCSPTDPNRVLLLGNSGLLALDPPYTSDALQRLVSFDRIDLPPLEDISGPFQSGPATVVIPRRSQTALRLDLSTGKGRATGLTHLPGGTALWTAYLQDDRETAARLLAHLTALSPAPSGASLHLHDILRTKSHVQAIATSAGIAVPTDTHAATEVLNPTHSPLDSSTLTTWALWFDRDDTLETACRHLCNAPDAAGALAESLCVLAGADALPALVDLLRSAQPPTGPSGKYDYPIGAIRSLVGPLGEDGASLVASALTDTAVPVRVAACAAAGATRADQIPDLSDGAYADPGTSSPLLWTDDHPIPDDALRANASHDHPAVRAAARDSCARLSIDAAPYSRRSTQSSQPDSPK